jgi:hypothetical protein
MALGIYTTKLAIMQSYETFRKNILFVGLRPKAHNDASQSVGFLWTSDQLVAETPLPDSTQHSQQTVTNASSGI